MKIVLLLLTSLFCTIVNAQETQTTKKPARVETEHEHKGASHQQTRSTGSMEHHSTSSWHYHSGPKRPQVPVTGLDSLKK